MTTLSLDRHLPRISMPRTAGWRLRRVPAAWRALVAHSAEAGRSYDTAPTTPARHKVLVQFTDTGA